jgi:hypothetical protein
LTAFILAPLIRPASPNLPVLMRVTKSKGARSYIPSCYGSAEISLRNWDSGQALPGCCARAINGHAAAPPRSVMNWRRFIARCLPCFRPKG